MYNEELLNVLEDAIRDFRQAIDLFGREVTPHVPLPRPRTFRLAPWWEWPYVYDDGTVEWRSLSYRARERFIPYNERDIAIELCSTVGWKPRAILRALRRIQAATSWCRARVAGRQRAAEEVLRQQRRAVEALEAEAAIRALGR